MTRTQPNRRLLLRCGVLLDGTGSAAREDVALEVEGERIVSIKPGDGIHDERSYVRDLRDCTVLPGLIDGHAHLSLRPELSGGLQLSPPAVWDDIAIVSWALAAATAALCSGITTVVDLGSYSGLALRAGQLIDAGLAVGPKVFASGAAITTTAGHGAEFGRLADNGPELVKAVRAAVADGAHVIKIMVTGGSLDPASNRRRAQYSEDEMRAGISDAHRLGKRVIGHANATEGIRAAVNAGIDIVAHCNWLSARTDSIEIDMGTIEAMAERNVAIDLNIDGALRDLRSDGVVEHWPFGGREPRSRWELLQPLRSKGIPIYLTSDSFGPAIAGFTGELERARSRWGLSAEELVAMVTGAPAQALGLDADRGTLVPGNLADVVVVRGDLRMPSTSLAEPLAVYRSGREVVTEGLLHPPARSLDEPSGVHGAPPMVGVPLGRDR